MQTITMQSMKVDAHSLAQGRSKLNNWGGGGGLIFIYSWSHTIRTIDFKRD